MRNLCLFILGKVVIILINFIGLQWFTVIEPKLIKIQIFFASTKFVNVETDKQPANCNILQHKTIQTRSENVDINILNSVFLLLFGYMAKIVVIVLATKSCPPLLQPRGL